MRKLAFLLFIAFSIHAMGQDNLTFDEYIAGFETYPANEIKKSDLWMQLSSEPYGSFITKWEECDCYDDAVYFIRLRKIEQENFVIAFVRESCDSYKDIPYSDIILFIYTKEGKIIDKKKIARDSGWLRYTLEGTVEPFEITIEQPKAFANDTADYRALPKACEIVTSKYTVAKNGKIIEKVISTEKGFYKWNSKLRDKEFVKGDIATDYVEDEPIVDFNKFMGYFSTIPTNEFEMLNTKVRWEWARAGKQIADYDERRAFVPIDEECECSKYEFWFRAIKKIEKENFIIAWIRKDCDIPNLGNYPYGDNMLFVYTKDGEVIDKKIIARDGDLWEYTLMGMQEPFEITVEQGFTSLEEHEKYKKLPMPCNVVTTKYTVDKDGKIIEEVLSSGTGQLAWNGSEIVVIKDK